MAITYPLDFIDSFPGNATLDLVFRQESAATRGGDQLSADIGPALWELMVQSRELLPTQMQRWKAILDLLENGAKTFYGWDKTVCYPIAHPGGWGVMTWPGGIAGQVLASSVPSGNLLNLKSVPTNLVLTVGDRLAVAYSTTKRALHRIVDIPDNSGATRQVEVRPTPRAGIANNDVVYLHRPAAIMAVIPGSVQTPTPLNGRGTISFSARQTPSAS